MLSKSQMVTLITIRDMNRAIRFYTKTLGGKLRYRGTGAMKDFWAGIKMGSSEIWLVAPEKWEKRSLAYTTFLVKNIKATVKELQGKGVKFQRAQKIGPETRIDGPVAWESSGAAAFFKDPDGNVLMVWQNIPPM
jgi:catechol 2,3-dioxygenase-like lactoylglutathione lyase family enzyme